MKAGLILASASPRRKSLLSQAGVLFTVLPAAIDESRHHGEAPLNYVQRMARSKAEAVKKPFHTNDFVLAADTVVFIGEHLFDKPLNKSEAARHLEMLSGREHSVVTAFCLMSPKGEVLVLETVTSLVTFRHLTAAEITAYAESGDGLDKAGAYGIQDGGGFLIDRVEGSYTNIIGLPLKEVLAALSGI